MPATLIRDFWLALHVDPLGKILGTGQALVDQQGIEPWSSRVAKAARYFVLGIFSRLELPRPSSFTRHAVETSLAQTKTRPRDCNLCLLF